MLVFLLSSRSTVPVQRFLATKFKTNITVLTAWIFARELLPSVLDLLLWIPSNARCEGRFGGTCTLLLVRGLFECLFAPVKQWLLDKDIHSI